uniref:Glycoside hydrolase family 5 C-terminal domain-containing protein n=1 Tax=Mycena chlorophos TaxID=658473 RepID=A0ABQ0LSP6_MYCCL|nr:predicted protein [Mycena chlorophos]
MYRIGGDDSSATAGAYGSEAGLLKKGGIMATVISAANSSLSLPTRTGVEAAGWRPNPFDFLTDGARAVRAFCRPWPTKLVGYTRSVDFDIATAHFRLVVAVRPQDRLREEELGSEIFVPLVHYAHSRLLRDSADTQSVASLDEELPKGSNNASTVNLVGLPSGPDMTASTSSASTEVPSADLRVTAEKGRDLVDIEVEVSGGRWEVEGQTLRWWYDVPAEGEREYTIDIRRRGGAIKVADIGWVDGLCPPESCLVM